MQYAVLRKNKTLIKSLIKSKVSLDLVSLSSCSLVIEPPLFIALKTGDVDFFKFMIDSGAELDINNFARGNHFLSLFLFIINFLVVLTTPLHYTTKKNYYHHTKLLLSRGASLKMTNINEETPFDITTNPIMMSILLHHMYPEMPLTKIEKIINR